MPARPRHPGPADRVATRPGPDRAGRSARRRDDLNRHPVSSPLIAAKVASAPVFFTAMACPVPFRGGGPV